MRTGVVLLALSAAACAPLPQGTPASPQQRAGLPVEARLSPNSDDRRPNYVILHHTSDASAEESLRVLTDPASGVSAHYLIRRDGRIFDLVDEKARSWHAGESY